MSTIVKTSVRIIQHVRNIQKKGCKRHELKLQRQELQSTCPLNIHCVGFKKTILYLHQQYFNNKNIIADSIIVVRWPKIYSNSNITVFILFFYPGMSPICF